MTFHFLSIIYAKAIQKGKRKKNPVVYTISAFWISKRKIARAASSVCDSVLKKDWKQASKDVKGIMTIVI